MGRPHALSRVVAGTAAAQDYPSKLGTLRVEEVATGLEFPWGLAFLPDGRMLVTEKPGRLLLLVADGALISEISGLPKIFVDGQAGLLDVALSPDFARDPWVYLSFAEPNLRGNNAGTAVLRGRLGERALRDVEVIYRQEPKLSSGTHVGSRLVFDDAGYSVHHPGRKQQASDRAGARQAAGQTRAAQRRRQRPEGQSVRRREARGRRSGRTAIATCKARRCIRARASCGRTNTVRRAATRSTFPSPARTTAGRSSLTASNYSGDPIPESVGTSAPGMEQPHHVWEESPRHQRHGVLTADRFRPGSTTCSSAR